MVHGGHGRRRLAERTQPGRQRPKSLGVDKKSKLKPKNVSLKNQIRSVERMLRKDLPSNVREAQEKKLEGIKKEQEAHTLKAKERKIFLRNRKIKFFERRKIERRIRRIERQQRVAAAQTQETELVQQLLKLKEDLEYVKFFPKTVEYVPLFVGGDNEKIVEKREEIRKQIKANIVAAAASGKDLEETGSEDDAHIDASEDDFFMSGSSSDADADDELTDRSTREQASSASYKAASGISSDERTQRQISARALMPPPRPSKKSIPGSWKGKKVGRPLDKRSSTPQKSEMSGSWKGKKVGRSLDTRSSAPQKYEMSNSWKGKKVGQSLDARSSAPQKSEMSGSWKRKKVGQSLDARSSAPQKSEMSTSSTTSNSYGFSKQGSLDPHTGYSDNVGSNSDARKPRRKRRPKKKKQ